MIKRSLIRLGLLSALLAVNVILLSGPFSPSLAEPYTSGTITDNSYLDDSPQINKMGQVVWRGYDGSDSEIFLYDGITTIQLTENSYYDASPQINDYGQVVWEGYDGSDSEIFLYDGSTTIQLTDNDYGDLYPQINDRGQVVWYGGADCSRTNILCSDAEIFLYDGSSIIQLTDNSYRDWLPRINNNGQVVWWGYVGSDSEIFLYDGSTTVNLTDNTSHDAFPQINSIGQVVWTSGLDFGIYSEKEVFLYNGTKTLQLTDNTFNDYDAQINDSGQVVWYGYDGSDWEIFFYNGTTTVNLTDNSYYDGHPQINDKGQVVWRGYDGSDYEIFLYDGSTTIQLTDNSYYDEPPQINDSGQVVWYGYDGSDWEIFLARTPLTWHVDSNASGAKKISSGTFLVDFLPTVKYPSQGEIWIRLMQNENNYYEISNNDETSPGSYPTPGYVRKVVNGVDVEFLPFQSKYAQNVTHTIRIDFSPTETSVNAFGETLTMNTDTNSIQVNSFQIAVKQQDAYFDNIQLQPSSFSDDFSTDTTHLYGVTHTMGTGQFLYDATGKRAEVKIGDDVALYFSRFLGDGLSWGNAFSHPQDAMNAALPGEQIWVADGTFTRKHATDTAVLTMKDGVDIYGGFAGDEAELSQRDYENNVTVLEGEDIASHVVVGADNARLDGFTITGGNSGGIINDGVSPEIRNCTFTGNSRCGMANYNNSPIIDNCTFINNYASSGICNSDSSSTITNSTFKGNQTIYSGYGGGITSRGSSSSTISECKFIGNFADNGGGAIYLESSDIISNCIIAGNIGLGNGGAIYINSGNPTITNCTLTGNYGGGIYATSNSSPIISNAILWDNDPSEISGPATITYSDIQGGYPGGGNIDTDPLFVDSGHWDDNGTPTNPYDDSWVNGNYHLQQPGSPCIDKGGATLAPDKDIEGISRPQGLGFDMGAYEVSFTCTDSDGDGYYAEGGDCGSADCDDSDASVNPDGTEVCNDLKDNDCDGSSDCVDSECSTDIACFDCTDSDGDSYSPIGGICGPVDCDDSNAAINPSAAETCNETDDNCNGSVDEGVTIPFYLDADSDGFGDINSSTLACSIPSGYVANNSDCNDADSLINPAADEICSDTIDNDCDGLSDCSDTNCVGDPMCTSNGGGDTGTGGGGCSIVGVKLSISEALAGYGLLIVAGVLWGIGRKRRGK